MRKDFSWSILPENFDEDYSSGDIYSPNFDFGIKHPDPRYCKRCGAQLISTLTHCAKGGGCRRRIERAKKVEMNQRVHAELATWDRRIALDQTPTEITLSIDKQRLETQRKVEQFQAALDARRKRDREIIEEIDAARELVNTARKEYENEFKKWEMGREQREYLQRELAQEKAHGYYRNKGFRATPEEIAAMKASLKETRDKQNV